jgi:hypothetical protein
VLARRAHIGMAMARNESDVAPSTQSPLKVAAAIVPWRDPISAIAESTPNRPAFNA